MNVVLALRIYTRPEDREKPQQAVDLTPDGSVQPFSSTEVSFLRTATLSGVSTVKPGRGSSEAGGGERAGPGLQGQRL